MMQATKSAPEVETVEFMDTSTLRAMLTDSLLFASKDEMRPILSAVRFEADAGAGTLLTVSTDSYTLCVRTQGWPVSAGSWQATVAREHVELIVKMLGRQKGLPAAVFVDDRAMRVRVDLVQVEVPLVTGEYPNWRAFAMEAGAGKNEKFHLNPAYLARVGKLSIVKDGSYAPLEVTGQGAVRPVILDGPGTRVLLMPVRK